MEISLLVPQHSPQPKSYVASGVVEWNIPVQNCLTAFFAIVLEVVGLKRSAEIRRIDEGRRSLDQYLLNI